MFLHACILNARREIPVVLERRGAAGKGHQGRVGLGAAEEGSENGEHTSSAVCSSFAGIVHCIFGGLRLERLDNNKGPIFN